MRFHKLRLTAVLLLVLAIFAASSGPGMIATADTAGYALEFDGNNDLVLLPETIAVFGSGWEDTKSVELWVLPQSAGVYCSEVGQCDLIFGDQPRWWGISQGILGGLDRIWVWNTDTIGTASDVIGIPYTVNEWLHITLVHSGGNLRAYQNGVELQAIPSGTTSQPGTGALPELRLGGMIKDITTWTFAGQIDEVRLWNTARTPAEVQADLYRELTGTESGLVAYYQMSDGSGLTLTDDSGHGWNGELRDGYQNVGPDGSPPQWVISTAFDLAPTASPSPTSEPPTPTDTPTATVTETPLPPTETPMPPTATAPPPTDTAVPPTASPTSTALPGGTATPPQPTAAYTPTPTETPLIPDQADLAVQVYLPISMTP